MFNNFLVASEGYIVHSIESGSLCCFCFAHWFAKVDFSVNWDADLVFVTYNDAAFQSAPVQHIEHGSIFLQSEGVTVNSTASKTCKTRACHFGLHLSLGVLFHISLSHFVDLSA